MALAWRSVADGSSSRGQIGEVGVAAILGSDSARRARIDEQWKSSASIRNSMSDSVTARPLFPATNVFGLNLPFNNFNCSTSMVFVSCCKHIDLPAAIVSRWVVLKRHQHFKH